MDREQKTINTTSGKVVLMKAYLTGREKNNVDMALAEGVMGGTDGEKPKYPLKNAYPYQRKLLEMLLISVDGKTENPADLLEDLPSAEYEDAVKQIKEAAGLSLPAAK